jgi:hypothetical protein
LLLTARYREQLRRHRDRHLAMAVALGRAAPAIIASAATVVLGLLGLLVAELNSTKSLARWWRSGWWPGSACAGAAGHRRPLGVLAAATHPGLGRADRAGRLGRIGARLAAGRGWCGW